jgi:hypothetical protein
LNPRLDKEYLSFGKGIAVLFPMGDIRFILRL